MLILSRRTNEKIRIGPDITIMVVEIGRGQVKLGIEAPSGLQVNREEIHDKIRKQERRAPREGQS